MELYQFVDKGRGVINFLVDDVFELVLEMWILRLDGFSKVLLVCVDILEDGGGLGIIRVDNFVVSGDIVCVWLLISHLLF